MLNSEDLINKVKGYNKFGTGLYQPKLLTIDDNKIIGSAGNMINLLRKEPFVIDHRTGISLEDTNPDAFSAFTAKSSPKIPAVFFVVILLITTTSSIKTEISSSNAKSPEAINATYC